MKKYKFITIRQDNEEVFEGHPVYRVFNNRSGGQLAVISWYKPWKQYVFSSQENCVFNRDCLRDILSFIETHDMLPVFVRSAGYPNCNCREICTACFLK